MISQTSEESISSAPPVAEGPGTDNIKRQPTPKRRFTAFGFFWKSREPHAKCEKEHKGEEWNKEEAIDNKIVESKLRNGSATRMSFDFLRNMKKHVHFRSLGVCKSKQKIKEIDTPAPLSEERRGSHGSSETEKCAEHILESSTTDPAVPFDTADKGVHCASMSACLRDEHDSNEGTAMLGNAANAEAAARIAESTDKTETEDDPETVPIENKLSDIDSYQNSAQAVSYSTVPNPQAEIVRRLAISDAVTSDSKVKASLTEELLKLSRYGWYWGPISGDEADAKLISEPDGAFLVRDSSDDRYVLTLSFKSSGKLLHTRMEHSGGLFSLCNQSENEGFTSVAALINHSMNFSQSAVFCYSRPKYPGYPSFPVRLTKPVSRFTQVRSLQYLCRFVIRQNTRLDNIHKLPLPKTIKGYIEEAHY